MSSLRWSSGAPRPGRIAAQAPPEAASTLAFHSDSCPSLMGWHGNLKLDYRRSAARTVVHDTHNGPLRVLQSLYPEGDAICHNVLVHPPGGVVGGDVLQISAHVAEDCHALVPTPGATRFYRSAGDAALQTLTAHAADGARLEWLPLETILYRNTLAENRMRFELAPGAEMMGWDVLALGLPASDEPF